MATVDILMATYNGERYVREQIESIQAQTFEDWRLLVSDDCSTDHTLEIVRDMAIADQRITIAGEGVRYGSAKANFMSLLNKASANYVMFCDQDDVWLPNKINITLNEMHKMEKSKGCDMPLLVFTDMKVVDGELHTIADSFERYSAIDPRRFELKYVLAQSVGAGCTMMMNREVVDLAELTLYDSFYIMHDWWITIIASSMGAIGYVDVPSTLYRQHGDNSVGANKFSISDSLRHFRRMRERFIATILQADSFRNVFGEKLSESKSNLIKDYVSILDTNRVAGIISLCTSGCWKRGIRKVGQVASILSGVNRSASKGIR